MKGLKGGPELPQWTLIVVVIIGLAILAFVGYRAFTGDGPRDPRTFPKEAYQPPGYSGKDGQSPYGPRPQGPSGQQGGNPYGGAYGNRPGGGGGNPYGGAYGNRPGGP